MKNIGQTLSFLGLLLSLHTQAQTVQPGGGELDITKPKPRKHFISIKKLEKAFDKFININWKNCNFKSRDEIPGTFFDFFEKFQDQTIVVDPNELKSKAKETCKDHGCTQEQIDYRNFQCLIQNEDFQNIFNKINQNEEEFKTYIEKYHHTYDFKKMKSFYKKLTIKYEE